MPLNRIKFSERWDKLSEVEFTTIRTWNKAKESYYRSLVGQEFKIAKAREKYPFRIEYNLRNAYLLSVVVVVPKDISPEILLKDVRLGGIVQEQWLQKLLSIDKALLLTFGSEKMINGQARLEVHP